MPTLAYFEAMAMHEPAPFNESAASERDYYREEALFKGDLPLSVGILNTSSFIHFHNTDPPSAAPSARRLRASLKKRSLLLTIESFEGWVVSVSRWIIQAASTISDTREATTIRGKAHGLLAQCSAHIHPSIDRLVQRVREAGVVRRTDVAVALAQCAAHHQLWSSLVRRGASANEVNRFGWQPLHYAAAMGIKQLVEEMLSLGASLEAKTRAGSTALHITAAHGSIAAARALAAHVARSGGAVPSRDASGRWSAAWLDQHGRSPEDVALAVPTTGSRCALLLKALQQAAPDTVESVKRRSARCTAAAEGRRRAAAELFKRPPKGKIEDTSWVSACGDAEVSSAETGIGAGIGAGNGAAVEGMGDDVAPCDISVLSGGAAGRNATELLYRYMGSGAPLLVRSAADIPKHWRANWSRDRVLARHGDVTLRHEDFPYSSASAPLFGVPENRTTIRTLLTADDPHSVFRCAGSSSRGKPSSDAELPPPLSVFEAIKGWTRVGDTPDQTFFEHRRHITPTLPETDGKGRERRGDILIDDAPSAPTKRPAKQRGGRKSSSSSSTRSLLLDWQRPPFIAAAIDLDGGGLLRTRSIQFCEYFRIRTRAACFSLLMSVCSNLNSGRHRRRDRGRTATLARPGLELAASGQAAVAALASGRRHLRAAPRRPFN